MIAEKMKNRRMIINQSSISHWPIGFPKSSSILVNFLWGPILSEVSFLSIFFTLLLRCFLDALLSSILFSESFGSLLEIFKLSDTPIAFSSWGYVFAFFDVVLMFSKFLLAVGDFWDGKPWAAQVPKKNSIIVKSIDDFIPSCFCSFKLY